jgi:Polysaccharide deacetylase
MKYVTLSFDNGPTSGVTERILEILGQAQIRATFFVIGNKLENPSAGALMDAAHRAGHWIGNHTLTHSIALGDRPSADYAATEIGETQKRIGAFAHPDKLFRPYGKSGLIGPHLFSKAAVAPISWSNAIARFYGTAFLAIGEIATIGSTRASRTSRRMTGRLSCSMMSSAPAWRGCRNCSTGFFNSARSGGRTFPKMR